MSEMFHAEPFDPTGVSNDSSKSQSTHQVENKRSSEDGDYRGVEGFFHGQDELGLAMSQNQIYREQNFFNEFGNLDDLNLDIPSPSFQLCEDETWKIIGMESRNRELIEPQKRRSCVFPQESFQLLRKYRSRRLKLDGKLSSTGYVIQSTHAGGPTTSTGAIINVAAEMFIQSMSHSGNELSMLNHPYPSSILTQSEEDSEGVQLVQNLLFCAEKVAEMQYERAIKFLKDCDKTSSSTGTPIQRLVFCFCEALFEKVAKETGRIIPKDSGKKPGDPLESVMYPNMNLLIAFHKEHPLSQISKLVGIQTILDHLEDARKVHMIDLEIRSGVHWIILMQAIAAGAEHAVQHLKITAMGTRFKSTMEETGRHLGSFAQSLNLKFTFKIVMVEDILDLNHNLFDLDADESVAVYAAHSLTSMIGRVDRLNHLMRVIRNMSPCVMIVTELEVNCNSPTFTGRFVESLFFFGAIFDSLADCFKNDEISRTNVESAWFRLAIRNILAAEGDQRKVRFASISVWRAFFAHLGLVEIEMSRSSLDQASLGLQSFPCWRSCTLYRDGKCLTICWKGTPLSSISAWKFQ